MRHVVTIRKSTDAGAIRLKRGDTVLGTIGQLAGQTDDVFSGTFSSRPAFADHAESFQALDEALGAAGDGAALRAEIERRGLVVWHSAHHMRIDVPGTIEIANGRARFRATGAFLALRTGGLG